MEVTELHGKGHEGTRREEEGRGTVFHRWGVSGSEATGYVFFGRVVLTVTLQDFRIQYLDAFP